MNGRYDNDPRRESLNIGATERHLAAAEKLRNDVIDDTFAVIGQFFVIDQEQQRELLQLPPELQPGQKLQYYILDDVIQSPSNPHAEVRTLSVLFGPKLELGQEREGVMRIAMPVKLREGVTDQSGNPLSANSIVLDENFDFTFLEPPDEVYVAKSKNGVYSHYIIGRNRAGVYIAEDETGEQVSPEDMDDESIMRGVAYRVSMTPLVAKIHEHMINMRVMPQRYWTVGETTHRDV